LGMLRRQPLRERLHQIAFCRRGAIDGRLRRLRQASRSDRLENFLSCGHFFWNVLPCGAGKSRTANQPFFTGTARTAPAFAIHFSVRAASRAAKRYSAGRFAAKAQSDSPRASAFGARPLAYSTARQWRMILG